jgi:pyruvate dehydrogenase E2 component (dihydrolipoamide acetyltransferase)
MQITTPDIGVDKATVAEILVKVGDTITIDESIVLLESDKASVEVPSTSAGVVKSILVNQGDEVSEGAVLIELEAEDDVNAVETQQADVSDKTSENTPTSLPDDEILQEVASHQPGTAAKQSQALAANSAASATVEVKVPDIGVEKALVGEILVQVGDEITVDQSIVVVESDKATVEVPSTVDGTVEAIQIKEGDTVKEGVVILAVKTAASVSAQQAAPESAEQAPAPAAPEAKAETVTQAPAAPAGDVEVKVPDLGVDKAAVAEILVQVGDKVEKDQSIIVVESDKATVEVPSTTAGVIKSIHVELGQNVSEGIALITIEAAGQSAPATAPAPKAEVSAAKAVPVPAAVPKVETAAASETQNADKLTKEQNAANAKVYAGPAVRKLARELGVVLAEVKASGPHARLMKEDLFAYVKTRLTAPASAAVAPAAAAPAGLPKLPSFDAFGGVEEKALTRLQQVSIPQLSLNNYIPQVTQFDLADITELEAWRNELKGNFKKEGLSLTIMSFIIKAVAHPSQYYRQSPELVGNSVLPNVHVQSHQQSDHVQYRRQSRLHQLQPMLQHGLVFLHPYQPQHPRVGDPGHLYSCLDSFQLCGNL